MIMEKGKEVQQRRMKDEVFLGCLSVHPRGECLGPIGRLLPLFLFTKKR
jgi:hypothetical protein